MKMPFEDVPSSAYYYKPVLWAYSKGIIAGVDKTHFAPNANVTRAQFVKMLYRICGDTVKNMENPFVDVAQGQYYTDPVIWAYHNGITVGKDSTHFNPGGQCTRGQIVTFLYRADKYVNK